MKVRLETWSSAKSHEAEDKVKNTLKSYEQWSVMI